MVSYPFFTGVMTFRLSIRDFHFLDTTSMRGLSQQVNSQAACASKACIGPLSWTPISLRNQKLLFLSFSADSNVN